MDIFLDAARTQKLPFLQYYGSQQLTFASATGDDSRQTITLASPASVRKGDRILQEPRPLFSGSLLGQSFTGLENGTFTVGDVTITPATNQGSTAQYQWFENGTLSIWMNQLSDVDSIYYLTNRGIGGVSPPYAGISGIPRVFSAQDVGQTTVKVVSNGEVEVASTTLDTHGDVGSYNTYQPGGLQYAIEDYQSGARLQTFAILAVTEYSVSIEYPDNNGGTTATLTFDNPIKNTVGTLSGTVFTPLADQNQQLDETHFVAYEGFGLASNNPIQAYTDSTKTTVHEGAWTEGTYVRLSAFVNFTQRWAAIFPVILSRSLKRPFKLLKPKPSSPPPYALPPLKA